MTDLLQRALNELQKRPSADQDAIAALILDELEDDKRWDESFAGSQDKLAALVRRTREPDSAAEVIRNVEPIARRELVGVCPSGERIPIVVEVGRPYPEGDPNENWRCPVTVIPLHHRAFDAGGYDSMQALCIAIRFASSLLTDFVERGGKLFFPDSDDEFDLRI
ncbi:MAG: hypothetical protein M3552_18385 [Planctomycetota bacterium]|nr:hypothetical protein [Planctomycetaceae bacterium]MDQ3332587.1 hypothetical protein [Planctomycetota bacterium]